MAIIGLGPDSAKHLNTDFKRTLKYAKCATIFYESGALVMLYISEKRDRQRFYLAIKALRHCLVI